MSAYTSKSLLRSVASIGALHGLFLCNSMAQYPLVYPTHGVAKLKLLQDAGDQPVSSEVHELQVTVEAGQTVTIPLGYFASSNFYTLEFGSAGHSAHSNGSIDFGVKYAAGKPYVFNEKRHTWQSKYTVESYPSGSGIGLVVHYKNVSPNSNVLIFTIKNSRANTANDSWSYQNPTPDNLLNLSPITPQIAQEMGRELDDDEGFFDTEGVYFYSDTVFRENANFEKNVSINGSPVISQTNSDSLLSGRFLPIPSSNNGSSDSLLLEGIYGGSGGIPQSGAGTRMMWYPERSAFRVGTAEGDQWDASNVGAYSVAMGKNVTARGGSSIALGSATKATQGGSTAMGSLSQATAVAATAAGYNSLASGTHSFAAGYYAKATGAQSVALGQAGQASGKASTATGYSNKAMGTASTAMGYFTRAVGQNSLAVGSFTFSNAFSSVSLGQYNESRNTTAGIDSWQGDGLNPVLEVGIGTASSDRKNALTILQDGSVELGKATATDNSIPLVIKADGSVILSTVQGDISMGIYGSSQ